MNKEPCKDLTKLKKKQLLELCEEKKIKNYKSKNKEGLIHILQNNDKMAELVEAYSELKITETQPDMNYYLLLHNRKWRKLNREFEEITSFPRHKYEMRKVFVDIRDHLTYNY